MTRRRPHRPATLCSPSPMSMYLFIDHNNMMNDFSTLYGSAGLSDESTETDDVLPNIRLNGENLKAPKNFAVISCPRNATIDDN